MLPLFGQGHSPHEVGEIAGQGLIDAARAVEDRVLLWGHYVVPIFHLPADRVAIWDRFGRPAITPLYGVQLHTWREDAEKAARLGRR